MPGRKQRTLLALLAGAVALLTVYAAGFAAPAAQAADLVGNSVSGVIPVASFAEPLVATGPTDPAEDEALSRAVAAYQRRGDPDDFSSLTDFLSLYPHSGWAPAVWTDLGHAYVHYGYLSRARDAWQQAWQEGRAASSPAAKALVDGAVGSLAQLDASLGAFDRLAVLFDEIGTRPVTGSATEAVQVAREELLLAQRDPRHLFLCGPLALRSLALARGVGDDRVRFLTYYRAGPDGTNLAEVERLADQAGVPARPVFRSPGQQVPVPSVMHWKVGHFAAILRQANGRFYVDDPAASRGQGFWVSAAAIDAEASGYFLVPAETPADAGWRSVAAPEAAGVWGKGPTNGTRQGGAGALDVNADAGTNNCPLCGYNIKESSVSVTLSDRPVGYSPPIGPSARVTITYNQREDSQPQNFGFFNVSPKWTLNWLSYVTDDPINPGASVSRYLAGGGAFYYSGYSTTTGRFAAQDNDGSILVLASQAPVTYERYLGDGSVEVYAQSDGATAYPRNIFLSRVIDPQGNALILGYDGQKRLVSLTDATGRVTGLTYGLGNRPLLVTQITDPFGRSATLGYDTLGRLSSITDVIGLTSSFTYDANSLVNSLTTPYGTSSFAYTAPGTSASPRFVQATDPLGYNEREEWLEPAPVPASDPAASVPQGMPLAPSNAYLNYRDSFHWDKDAYVAAGCTAAGGCDYAKARMRHFLHMPGQSIKSTVLESVKYPLENRIWYNYQGQSSGIYGGSFDSPVAVGRVLDDGTTQISRVSYDSTGFFKPTQVVDPRGRTTSFAYANHIDLSAISQTTAHGFQTTIAQFVYDMKHRPLYYTDAAGQTAHYTYNAAGQLLSATDPLGHTTSYQYDVANNLTAVVNANGVAAASYTYDAFDRVATVTDSEGWSVAYSYDAADRITKATYPDGTAESYTYDRLDLAAYRDRLGRIWRYEHDAGRRLTATTDPSEHRTQFAYNGMGALTGLTDANGNTTTWTYDIEGRLTAKHYADGSGLAYAYEATTSRLASVTDALGQVRQYSYAVDDRLAGITYLNPVNPTPNIAFTDDPYFPRRVSMTDGNGTTQYGYGPVGQPGALLLQEESGPLPAGTITYGYDVLGRMTSRAVAGAGAESFDYDVVGRLTGHSSDLGQFTLGYLSQTGQVTSRQRAGSTLATSWSYLPNTGDRRLAGISTTGFGAGQVSTYAYTTVAGGRITAIAESSDAPAAYPAPGQQTAGYNNLNQLTNLSGQALTYDAAGNLLSDGQRNYAWDAENRLVAITYPGTPGKASGFTYDGLGRRTAIVETPAGGGDPVTTSYLWCGARPCQARDVGNTVLREFLAEGEFVPGSPGQAYAYGPDQLGSVRRVFASNGSATAYDFDPYGVALQAQAPTTMFGYAGMQYHPASGLYLTTHRAYDPATGRFLSRDPLGEAADPTGNLYAYVGGNPIAYRDPSGGFGLIGAAIGGALGGGIDLALQLVGNGGDFGCVSWGQVAVNAGIGAVIGATGGLAGPEAIAAREVGVAVEEVGGVVAEEAAGTVRFSPINPGPLAEDIANTFRSGTYTGSTLTEDTTLYRVIGDSGNPAGSFWTRTQPSGPLQSVIDSALDQSWGNTATTTVTRTFPSGTRILEGVAAPQGGLVGGGNQIYIPQPLP